MVDRVKPRFMVNGLAYGSVHGSVHGFVYGFVYGLVYVLDNVPIEHGGLHCVLPCAVLPDLGHPPDTQGYLGLLAGLYTPSHTL